VILAGLMLRLVLLLFGSFRAGLRRRMADRFWRATTPPAKKG